VVTSTNPTGGAGAWTIANVDPGIALRGVSCPSVSLCVAVDELTDVVTTTNPTGGPGAWTVTVVPALGLRSVSCPSVSLCVAVDDSGNVVTSTNPAGPPRISGLRASPFAFVAAGSGPSATAARTRTGTTVSFTLNRAGRVRFTVEKPAAGRRVRGGCMAPSRRNRHNQRCTRYARVRGSFSRTGAAGANRFHFTGRMGGRKLPPGGSRLVAVPAGGQAAKRTGFRTDRLKAWATRPLPAVDVNSPVL
jgi:hypothetical protein